jgi:hypothetical protein
MALLDATGTAALRDIWKATLRILILTTQSVFVSHRLCGAALVYRSSNQPHQHKPT